MKLNPFEKIRRLAGPGLAGTNLMLLSGCRGAPSINLLGSFFPAWMLCIALGVIGTYLARQIFIKLGVERHLKPRPLIYFCLWMLITVASWLWFFRS